MFVELHMIQNFAPSCLNRDDTNTPKDCEFGGHRRARISSQCLKRSVRWHPVFTSAFKDHMGCRTKLLDKAIRDRLQSEDISAEEVDVLTAECLRSALLEKPNVLLFLSLGDLDKIAEAIVQNWATVGEAVKQVMKAETSKKRKEADGKLATTLKQCLGKLKFGKATDAVDIALFGRMIAERQQDEVDASCQVAHAISTHKVLMDMDFYTAVDDLKSKEDDPGAGMMGEVEFNSSCFYRYSLIDTNQLVKNLQGDIDLSKRAVEAFIRASVAAIPSGKQNTFAAQNVPAMVLVVIRDEGAPWSLTNAFESPVRIRPNDEDSLSDKSIRTLDKYWGRLESVYGSKGIKCKKAVYLGLGDVEFECLESARNLDEVVKSAMEAVEL